MPPPKSLAVRGGLARTFGSLAGFLVLTFFCLGIYILEDAFANPLNTGEAAILDAAFSITLAARLLFFLFKPAKRPRTHGLDRPLHSPDPAVRYFFDPAAGTERQDNLRNNLAYQRFYVDHSRIQP